MPPKDTAPKSTGGLPVVVWWRKPTGTKYLFGTEALLRDNDVGVPTELCGQSQRHARQG